MRVREKEKGRVRGKERQRENSGDKKEKGERGKSMLPVGFEPTTFRSSV